MEALHRSVSGTFLAVVMALPEDGEPYQYFVDAAADLDVTSAADLTIAILPRYSKKGDDNYADLFSEKGAVRYPGLLRTDLPCVWLEDHKKNHFVVDLNGLAKGEVRDRIRYLIDLAAEKDFAAEVQAGFEARYPRETPPPVTPPKPGNDAGNKETEQAVAAGKTPWGILLKVTERLPVARWVLGFVALALAYAVVKPFISSPVALGFGVVGVLLTTVLFYIFNLLTKADGPAVKALGIAMGWAVFLLFIGTLGLLVSIVTFGQPMTVGRLVGQFQGESRVRAMFLVKNRQSGDPVPAASITLEGATYSSEGATDTAGAFAFQSVPAGEDFALLVSAKGFSQARRNLRFAAGEDAIAVLLDPVAPPPAPPPAVVTPVHPAPGQGGHPPVPLTTADLEGTWQIQVTGDINNVRVRNGTFRFAPQPDGEVLVSATFRADGVDVMLNGSASLSGSQVHASYTVKGAPGGPWMGRATFTLRRGQLNGRFDLRNNESVPLLLRKETNRN